jgi:hypothetical protein
MRSKESAGPFECRPRTFCPSIGSSLTLKTSFARLFVFLVEIEKETKIAGGRSDTAMMMMIFN